MILNNSINAGSFIYCMAYFGPNETNTYYNIGHGHYHQCIYIVDGQGLGCIKDDQGNILALDDTNRQGQLVDLSDTKGLFHETKTTEHGLTVVMFNPIPDTRILNVEILKGAGSHTITATDKRKTLVCITGPIKANDKELVTLQHAKILPNKTVDLHLPENTVCAIVSE
jgi:hypothetical protein